MPKSQALSPAFAGFRQLSGGGFSFTMFPNQFLDEIVPFEKPCVFKVVCLILRRTLGWIDQDGQRRQQDQIAYSEFAREMNMSTQAVADGLKIALDKGYIIRVKAGTMRDATSGNPEAACYSLRWSSPLPTTVPAHASSQTSPSSQLKAAPVALTPADSENQTDQPSLINRDMINKADSEKINQLELKSNSKSLICRKPGIFSSYIGNLVSDIGEQFGDSEHHLSNIKQALNCWEKSKLTEKEFVQLLYQARNLTRQHTNALTNSAGIKRDDSDKPLRSSDSWVTLAGTPAKTEISNFARQAAALLRNRMPYFFKVLQDLVYRPAIKPLPEKLTVSPTTGQPLRTYFKTARKLDLVLHNSSPVALVEREKESETVSFGDPVEQAAPASSSKNRLSSQSISQEEAPPELKRLAESFVIDYRPVLTMWQTWEASLPTGRLKALARRALPIERNQIRQELQTLLFPPESNCDSHQPDRTDILLVFRNAFDARYGSSFITEITASLEKTRNGPIAVYITHF